MLSDKEFSQLPHDNTLAFLQLEAAERKKLDDALLQTAAIEDGRSSNFHKAIYMNAILAIDKNLEVVNFPARFTKSNGAEEMVELYNDFRLSVDTFVITARMQNAKRSVQYSVKLDGPTKEKIRFYIDRIKETVDKLEIPTGKKDTIYKKLNALALEVDRERTRLDIIMDAVLTVADTGGQAGRKLKPLMQLINPILGLLSRAQETEEQLSLPPPVKRLPAPRRKRASKVETNAS
jgi:hypothetical protein